MPIPYKIIFLGTPDFACPTLEKLANDSRFQIQAVITQEDKKTGRKQLLTASPVKQLAQKLGLTIFQPIKLSKDKILIENIKTLQPDFLVVVAYGQIVSQEVLNLAKIKPINIHGSILPKYRGASPIEQTLLNGDSEAGISIMEMTLKMDQGPVYQIHKLTVEPQDNNPLLRQKLCLLGAEKLPDSLIQIATGQLTATVQIEDQATYCQKISKEDGLIKPETDSAATIINKLKAFNPWPGIYLKVKDKNLKILAATASSKASKNPGQFEIFNQQIFLDCADLQIEITELQLEGKTTQNSATFLMGNRQILLA